MDASVKCYVTSFKTKQDSDEQSNDDVVHIFSFGEGPNVDWKLTCDKLKLERNRQVVFAKAPWSFRHILDETSPLLKPTVRNQCRELGCWPPDINNHEKIRHCLSPDVNAIVSCYLQNPPLRILDSKKSLTSSFCRMFTARPFQGHCESHGQCGLSSTRVQA